MSYYDSGLTVYYDGLLISFLSVIEFYLVMLLHSPINMYHVLFCCILFVVKAYLIYCLFSFNKMNFHNFLKCIKANKHKMPPLELEVHSMFSFLSYQMLIQQQTYTL